MGVKGLRGLGLSQFLWKKTKKSASKVQQIAQIVEIKVLTKSC